jgi:hypothetical protein
MTVPLQHDEQGDIDALAELFHDVGVPPERAMRYARWVVTTSAPEFGEEE